MREGSEMFVMFNFLIWTVVIQVYLLKICLFVTYDFLNHIIYYINYMYVFIYNTYIFCLEL